MSYEDDSMCVLKSDDVGPFRYGLCARSNNIVAHQPVMKSKLFLKNTGFFGKKFALLHLSEGEILMLRTQMKYLQGPCRSSLSNAHRNMSIRRIEKVFSKYQLPLTKKEFFTGRVNTGRSGTQHVWLIE